MHKYYVKIMADYFSTGIWDMNEDGINSSLEEILNSSDKNITSLQQEIQEWNDYYDKNAFDDRDNPNFNWASFNEKGKLLAKKVKDILGKDSKVIYFEEYGFPWDKHTIIEIE